MVVEEIPVILDNDRDKRTWTWLQGTVEPIRLQEAIDSLAGKRKPYVSNVCKLLKIEPPEEVILAGQLHEALYLMEIGYALLVV